MTLRSFFSGLWRGLDGLRKALHLILLLVLFGVLIGVLRSSVPRIPSTAAPQAGKERAERHHLLLRRCRRARALPAPQIFSSILAALPERSRR